MIKRFLEWIGLKEKLHSKPQQHFDFYEGEVWWTSIGENIGVEINGKGHIFTRPVFIYKRLSQNSFMGIPLSTKMKEGSWYISVDFQGQTVVAHLAQVRVFSASRLYGRMGILEEKSRAKIKSGFIRLYC